MSAGLCLLHGFAGSPESWDEVAALLPPGSVVLRPALLGHGVPGPPRAPGGDDAPASFDTEVDRIARLIAGAPAGPLHLCGYSLGARIAVGLLVRHQRLFCRATLIGVHPGLSTDAERAARRQHDERWASLLEHEGLDGFLCQWEAQPLFASQLRLPAPVRAAQRARRTRLSAAGLARCLRALSLSLMPDQRGPLSRLALPVQLLAGADDAKFRDLAEGLVKVLPRGTLTLVSRAGHNVPLEAPQAVAAALLSPG